MKLLGNIENIIIEGKLSVEAVLQSKNRKIFSIYFDHAKLHRKKNKQRAIPLKKLLSLANSLNIPTKEVDSEWFNKNTKGKSHGGVAAEIGVRKYQELSELVGNHPKIIIMLDGIEDPYNLGYTIRSLFAAGIDGLVLQKRNWTSYEDTVVKSSAGTFESMPIAQITDLDQTIGFFRSKTYKIAYTTEEDSKSIYEENLSAPLFLIIGGEKRGITRSSFNTTDLKLNIPYGREFDGSLPLSSAAIVVGFEILRQNQILKK